MTINEIKLINAFKTIKEEMTELRTKIEVLTKNQNFLIRELSRNSVELKIMDHEIKDSNVLDNKNKDSDKKEVIGAKNGTVAHNSTCPFGKNIIPKNKITFNTKNDALDKGYKLCECMKL